VLGKVASIVQKNMGNLTSGLTGGGIMGIAGGLVGSLMSKAQNSVAQNAAAAKILNKSPLELNDISPVAHMKQNPFEYGVVFYPEDVQNLGTGHYMFIDCIRTTTIYTSAKDALQNFGASMTKGTKLAIEPAAARKNLAGAGTAAERRQVKQMSGINSGSFGSRHSEVSDTIVLYTPPGLKTNYSVQHEGTETGMLGDILGANFKSPSEIAMRLKEVGSKFLTEFGSMAISLIPGAGDLKGALQKVTGRAFNNNLEMVFKGVPMREFSYTFEFAPRNRRELQSAQKIINLLKYHMHPELDRKSNDFVVPSQFQLTYMYMEKQNTYIPKISKCVLKSLELQHGDDGVFSTFAGDELGAAPIYTKMTLQFAETEIMTKATITDGF